MSTFCRYQCPAHHGIYVHTPDCPVIPERPVCDGCVAEIAANRTGNGTQPVYCPACDRWHPSATTPIATTSDTRSTQ